MMGDSQVTEPSQGQGEARGARQEGGKGKESKGCGSHVLLASRHARGRVSL